MEDKRINAKIEVQGQYAHNDPDLLAKQVLVLSSVLAGMADEHNSSMYPLAYTEGDQRTIFITVFPSAVHAQAFADEEDLTFQPDEVSTLFNPKEGASTTMEPVYIYLAHELMETGASWLSSWVFLYEGAHYVEF